MCPAARGPDAPLAQATPDAGAQFITLKIDGMTDAKAAFSREVQELTRFRGQLLWQERYLCDTSLWSSSCFGGAFLKAGGPSRQRAPGNFLAEMMLARSWPRGASACRRFSLRTSRIWVFYTCLRCLYANAQP